MKEKGLFWIDERKEGTKTIYSVSGRQDPHEYYRIGYFEVKKDAEQLLEEFKKGTVVVR